MSVGHGRSDDLADHGERLVDRIDARVRHVHVDEFEIVIVNGFADPSTDADGYAPVVKRHDLHRVELDWRDVSRLAAGLGSIISILRLARPTPATEVPVNKTDGLGKLYRSSARAQP
jgi:hypothetical protein